MMWKQRSYSISGMKKMFVILLSVILLSVSIGSQAVHSEAAPSAVQSNGKKVAIDAGHQARGNSSTEPVGPGSSTRKAKIAGGATGVSSRVPEYKLTLSIAKKLKKELTKRGYEVYMVRSSHDVNISNKQRAQRANKSGADIYIRLHGDSSTSSSVRGASGLYPSSSNPYVGKLSKSSKRLTKKVLSAYCKKSQIANQAKQ